MGRQNGDKTLRWARSGVVKKLALESGRVMGLQIVGEVDRAGMFLEMIKKGRNVTEFGDGILSPDFSYGRFLKPISRNGKGYMALRGL